MSAGMIVAVVALVSVLVVTFALLCLCAGLSGWISERTENLRAR